MRKDVPQIFIKPNKHAQPVDDDTLELLRQEIIDETILRANIRELLSEAPVTVRGYMKPIASFFTLAEWEEMALYLLDLQSKGMDTRGGEISCKHASFCSTEDFEIFITKISEYFGYQLTTEVDRWDLLTRKNVLDFIEDFVNHILW